MKIVLLVLCCTLWIDGVTLSQNRITEKALLSDHYVKFAPNKLTIWFSNNGDQSYNRDLGWAGWEYPSGSGKYVGFESGLIWGGVVDGEIRVGGSTLRHGLQGGKILPNGKPTDSTNALAKIYAIKRGDEQTGTNWDYNNWPHWDGAPVDQNLKPSMCGDEQLWFVSNDLNPNRTTNFYNSQPIGLEIQTTVWAYNRDPLLKEAVFVRHLLINKGAHDLRDAYLGMWCDYDLGESLDDFVGVDTTLGLGYCYNGIDRDLVYGNPPAAGILFMQTPIVVSVHDSVLFKGRRRVGYKPSPLAGHQFFFSGTGVYREPNFADTGSAQKMYMILQGLLYIGKLATDPITKEETRFTLAGDPISRQGWIDGIIVRPGDRWSLLSAGPFQLAKNDTQEVVYAMIAKQDTNRFESLARLREYARFIRNVSCDGVINSIEEKPATSFSLSQNFPNPFHDQTSITFSLPHRAHVRLNIFDALGREVTTLVDEEREAGEQVVEVDLNRPTLSLPSGVYFYQLEVGGKKLMKKMLKVDFRNLY